MSRPSPLATVVIAAVLLTLGPLAAADPPAAGGGGAVVVVTPVDPGGKYRPPAVQVGVRASGRYGHQAGPPTGDRAAADAPCRYVPDPDMELIERGRGTPTVGAPAPGAHLYARVCRGSLDGWVWLGPGVRPAAAGPTAAELAREAYRELVLPAPVIGVSPPAWAPQLVGVPTWLWVERGGWGRRSATAAVPGLAATAVAVPVRVVWSLGDGASVLCAGPGAVFRAGVDDPYAASPDCGHTYRRVSTGRPGGVFTVTATVFWRVSWSGGGRSGRLPDLQSTGVVRLRVVESQAVNR